MKTNDKKIDLLKIDIKYSSGWESVNYHSQMLSLSAENVSLAKEISELTTLKFLLSKDIYYLSLSEKKYYDKISYVTFWEDKVKDFFE